MPTLHWIGKEKVINHHHDVPFRLLKKQYAFQAKEGTPENSTGNRIIHGDNLEALKSLLPEFEGRINCIYIDPPYNTGNEGWVYNDNVNDPKIKKWLGEVVGKEGEDLSRHDKWLCMMYPRLKLLHRLLAEDGVIFISIDDNEQANLKLLMDEIFGVGRFVAQIPWKKRTAKSDVPYGFSQDFEWILCYAKKEFLAGVQHERKYYSTHDYPNDRWRLADLTKQTNAEERPNSAFDMVDPKTGKIYSFNPKRTWVVSKDTFRNYYDQGKIVFPDDYGFLKGKIPAFRVFESEDREKSFQKFGVWDLIKSVSTQLPEGIGKSQDGNKEMENIFGEKVFSYPKPSSLIKYLVSVINNRNSIILDSFAGSGTTAHAVLKLNAEDGGNRRFICVEMMDYAETITAERVRRVMNGYGEGKKAVGGLGGGFDYYTVDMPLFIDGHNLNEEVGAEAIRHYVAYTEGIPSQAQLTQDNTISPYALGVHNDALYAFYYERERITTLGVEFLNTLNLTELKPRPSGYIIYADKCAVDDDFLLQHGIVFKRIPRDISRL